MGIFDKRDQFKPFEYQEASGYKDAINHSYWLVSEWNFTGDVQDFHVKLTNQERNAVKNAMLAISQIEVSVKKFWARLGDRFPKAEFEQVGVVFGESEVRHSDAYSHLLEVMGLNEEFGSLMSNPVIRGRVDYLSKHISGSSSCSDKNYVTVLALFSIFTEYVSLFSQFLVIKAFNKHKNVLKDIDNVIQATQKEESLHAMFGIYIINEIKKEFPEWFTEEFYLNLEKACLKANEAESKIIDWIFEQGDLSFLSKDQVKEYTKKRFNESLAMIGGREIFKVEEGLISNLSWFDEEIYAEINTDFFHKRPVTYSKKSQPIQAEDIF
jgi:ribonucleoside-diphosphate reductase beta chain